MAEPELPTPPVVAPERRVGGPLWRGWAARSPLVQLMLARTREFYRGLGFTGMLFESDGYFEPMHPWYAPREPPSQHMTLLTNPHGAGMEPVEHHPPSPDMRGEWGHLGPFDFGVGVRNIEQAAAAVQARGIELLCEPQTIELGGDASWSYAYFVDPDELYVCITEARY